MKSRFSPILALRRRLLGESGQAAPEYALITFLLVFGGGAALVMFGPTAVNAYNIYIHGFYFVLGLPIP